jgi:hypothetical protein
MRLLVTFVTTVCPEICHVIESEFPSTQTGFQYQVEPQTVHDCGWFPVHSRSYSEPISLDGSVLRFRRVTTMRLNVTGLWDVTTWRLVDRSEELTAWKMSSSGMCRRVVLVVTDVSEEHISSIFRVKTITELKHFGNSNNNNNRSMFLRNVGYYKIHTETHPRRRHSS